MEANEGPNHRPDELLHSCNAFELSKVWVWFQTIRSATSQDIICISNADYKFLSGLDKARREFDRRTDTHTKRKFVEPTTSARRLNFSD